MLMSIFMMEMNNQVVISLSLLRKEIFMTSNIMKNLFNFLFLKWTKIVKKLGWKKQILLILQDSVMLKVIPLPMILPFWFLSACETIYFEQFSRKKYIFVNLKTRKWHQKGSLDLIQNNLMEKHKQTSVFVQRLHWSKNRNNPWCWSMFKQRLPSIWEITDCDSA